MRKAYVSILAAAMMIGIGAGAAMAADPVVSAKTLAAAPTLDGKADDWAAVTGATIKVAPGIDKDDKNFTGNIDIEIKAGVSGDTIYMLVQWPDETQDTEHKPLVWNKTKDAYDTAEDKLEDRLALTFDMGGDFNSCMLAGTAFKADTWHWKSFRSGTVGLVHDQMHIISFEQMPKAKEHPGMNGKKLWLARPADAGDELYTTQRPLENIGEKVPKYLVNANAKGSVADVKAKAAWANNKWTLEMSRKLDTGNADDVKFEKGKTYKSGVAAFNHAGDDHHSVAGFTLEVAK